MLKYSKHGVANHFDADPPGCVTSKPTAGLFQPQKDPLLKRESMYRTVYRTFFRKLSSFMGEIYAKLLIPFSSISIAIGYLVYISKIYF